jgi:hypothetical protein
MAYQTPDQIAEIIAQYEASKNPGDTSRNIGQRFKNRAAQAQQFANETVANTSAGLRNQGFNTRNIGGTGAVGAGVFSTINQLQQGQLTGAIASVPGAMLGGAGMSALVKNIPGPFGKLARVVAPALGAYGGGELSAGGAEGIKNAITGQQTGNKSETKGTEPPAYIPGTNIPLNETARYLESQKAIGNLELDFSNRMNAADRAGMKDIMQHSMETQIQLSKRLDPIIQQSKDKDMVRTQALMNTSGNIDARLGMLATQGALAKGAQSEAGALARTFAGTNPYAQFANRQSPNIQFG